MKKILSLLLLTLSQTVTANECLIINPLKPGGGFDHIIRVMQKSNPDIVVNYKFGAYTIPAMQYADKNPDVGIISLPNMYSKNSPEKNPNVDIIRIIGSYDHGIITSKKLTMDDVLTKKVNVGINFLGSPAHIIAEDIKKKNSNVEIIPFGGDGGALIPLKKGDIDVYITAWGSIEKWTNEFQFKTLAKVTSNSDYTYKNLTLKNYSRVGIYMSKNATIEQKNKMLECINSSFENDVYKKDFEEIHLTPLNMVGKEAEKQIDLYKNILNLYGI